MEPIEKKSILFKPSIQHRIHNDSLHDKKKQKIIQWDEVTIAEHDKERGSRQKIDEAPTPYRYGSESDQSEAESGSSDGEHLNRRRKVSAGSFDQANPDPDTIKNTANNSQATSSLVHKYAKHSVMFQWEAVQAKLTYEKHLQDLEQLQHQQQQQQFYPFNSKEAPSESGESADTRMVCDEHDTAAASSTAGVPNNNNSLPFPSFAAPSYDDNNTVGDENEEDDDDGHGFDPPTTEFGEIMTHNVPPQPPAVGLKPVRPALKMSSSLAFSTGISPTKLSMKRSTSQELQVQLQQQQQQQQSNPNNNNNNKPHKSVHIRTTVVTHPISSSSSLIGHPSPVDNSNSNNTNNNNSNSDGSSGAGSFSYASVVANNNNNNNSYFRYSNPDGYHTTNHSSLFAGINASMGGGHDHEFSRRSGSLGIVPGKGEKRDKHSSHEEDNDEEDGEGDDETPPQPQTQQFKNKRAGHYNEYKVLLAMRAKMMEEDDEDDED